MHSFPVRTCAATILLVLSVLAPLPAAEDQPVTIENLVARVPILSPKNEKLSSFYFKAEYALPIPGKPLSGGEVAWTRDGGLGVVGVAGKCRSPHVFLAENWLFVYDVTSATAIVGDKIWPDISLAAEEDKFLLSLGYTGEKEKSGVHIDLPSFLRPTEPEGTLKQIDARIWRYVVKSPTGRSVLLADFEPAKPFPLARIEIVPDEKLGGPFVLSEISVNEPVPARLTKFPKLEQFPRQLVLQDRDSIHRHEYVEEITAGVLFGRFALDDPEMRRHERFARTDWDKAEKTDALILPQLRQLLLSDDQPAPE